jgi:hypothetical protein
MPSIRVARSSLLRIDRTATLWVRGPPRAEAIHQRMVLQSGSYNAFRFIVSASE